MKKQYRIGRRWFMAAALALVCAMSVTCAQDNEPPDGLAKTPGGAGPVIKFDLNTRPFPEIPFPNDLATRVDKSSPTGLRLNVSQVADTHLERDLRAKIDRLDGFGIFGGITIAFDEPIDINILIQRQQMNDVFDDDAVFLINMNPRSPNYGKAVPLDMGRGNFPLQLERNNNYFLYDTRANASNLFFETYDEDVNGNNIFDPYIDIDTDFDGVFDHPNVFYNGAWRVNPSDPWSTYHNLVDFYERETNTLIMRPVLPLEEESEYAVVITKRLKGLPDASGMAWPVRSPFAYINHTEQTKDLWPLKSILPRYGLSIKDVAFAWKFTTGSMTRDMVAIRNGLYGHGPMAYLGTRFPAKVSSLIPLPLSDVGNPYKVKAADFIVLLQLLITSGLGDAIGIGAGDVAPLISSYDYVDYFTFGNFRSPYFLIDRDGMATKLYPADEDEVFQMNPLTGAAVVGGSTVPFLCSIPKPNYRLEQIYSDSAAGILDYSGIETHVNHRLGQVATDSANGSIDRTVVIMNPGAMARRYELTFTGAATFDAMDKEGNSQGSGDTGTDFTTNDGWLTIPAAAWAGTFATDEKVDIDIEPWVDPVAGPITQTYTVTFTSASAFNVTDGSASSQGSGDTSADFTTDDSWLTIYAAAWSGSFAPGDSFQIDTVAMGPPFPTVIEGHGYTSMKFEMLGFAGNLAKHGLAVCDNDAVGHGVGLSRDVQDQINQIKQSLCYPPADPQIAQLCNLIDPILDLLKGRARDLNNDGVPDSGGDFWSADTFHTRDIVRQSIIDQMQLIRIIRAFDGSKTWNYDMNLDGSTTDNIAGDFNGDGVVDFGGPTGDFHTWGISLGGILSGILAGMDPAITSATPVSGGAGLIDIAARSTQGGVVQAVFLPLFGPIVLGRPSGGNIMLQWLVSNVNSEGYVNIGLTDQVQPGDKIVVKNLNTGKENWAIAASDKSFRVHIPADAVDAVEKRHILGWGPDYVPGDTCRPLCDVPDPLKLGDPISITIYDGDLGAVKQVVDTWLQDSEWQGSWFEAGTPLVAPAQGLGFYRGTPDFRRFLSIAQTIMDPADPGTYAAHYFTPLDPATAPNSYYTHLGPLNFPYEHGIQMGANVLDIPTIGDTNVPQNTGIAIARNAGIIELFKKDPRYGKTDNQVLLDNHIIEGVEKIEPYTVQKNASTYHILFDIDDLDDGGTCDPAVYHYCKSSSYQDYICTDDNSTDPAHACGDGYNAPVLRDVSGYLDPLRLTVPTVNGVSGMRMPYMQPTGQHGFDVPHPNKAFDIELYNINMIGRYFQTNGQQILNDPCLESDSCINIPPPPQ